MIQIEKEIQARLFELQDLKYRDFQCKLMPTVDPDSVIGVRTPELRKLAKERRITVIMSLHELDLAQKVSDLVMCVKGETVTHIGPPQEIFNRDITLEEYIQEKGM